ncbi:MAG: pyrroline-5-carboxylate reductase [Bacillota bacterium]|nr:pyrroline-5-carboxylate reductase [Bacillota bacterium]MDK2855051.1 pyrroline-5-carboxylate reductase [Bacillota bacterium]MDK2924827.1 pyrroline-5-carboxylate reductase [Bacillota bacterium]
MIKETLGFIGAGAMAEALLRGFIAQGLVEPKRCLVSDISAERARHLANMLKVGVAENNREVLAGADIVFLAVKPQSAPGVLEELKSSWEARHLVVSIMAGVPTSFLEPYLGQARLVRVMPNTPCLVQAGAAGIAGGSRASERDVQVVAELFSAVGKAFVLSEDLLDAVTALSGSAPAYVYMFIEALADGGVLAGLPRPVAQTLAAQTVLGAAKMVLETGEHPGSLKDRVASPAGTTIAGIAALEAGGFRGLVLQAVKAGAERSAELGAAKK